MPPVYEAKQLNKVVHASDSSQHLGAEAGGSRITGQPGLQELEIKEQEKNQRN